MAIQRLGGARLTSEATKKPVRRSPGMPDGRQVCGAWGGHAAIGGFCAGFAVENSYSRSAAALYNFPKQLILQEISKWHDSYYPLTYNSINHYFGFDMKKALLGLLLSTLVFNASASTVYTNSARSLRGRSRSVIRLRVVN
ncbi:MAG: hypothetical protein ABIT83_17410 [Massilia sp.]